MLSWLWSCSICMYIDACIFFLVARRELRSYGVQGATKSFPNMLYSLHIRNIAAVRQFALLYLVGLSKNAVFHGIPQNGHFKKEHYGFGQPAPFMWENTDGPTRCQPGFGNLWFLVGCIGANGTCRFGAACLQSMWFAVSNARIMIGVEITLAVSNILHHSSTKFTLW